MTKLSGAQIAVRALKEHGVDTIFTLVGDHTLPLCDAAIDEGIRFIDTRHEAAAVHMADACSRATGRPAVVLVTGGPGHANSLAGLAAAYKTEAPIIHISGRPELQFEGMGALQELDQIETTAPIAKHSDMVRTPERLAEAIHAAFRNAMAGRPGPVHLTIPLDIQEASLEVQPVTGDVHRNVTAPSAATDKTVQQMLALLARAERPVIVAGNAARFGVDPDDLRALAERTGIPLFTVESARGLVSDDHELCMGYADSALNYGARLIAEADAILLLGKKFDFRIGYGRPPRVGADAAVIQVDPDATEIGRHRGVTVGVAADIGTVVRQLAAAAPQHSWPDRSGWVGEIVKARSSQLESMRELAGDTNLPLHPMTTVTALEPFLSDDDFLVFDTGDYVQWGRSYLSARTPGRWYRVGPLGHLGSALPLAMGCQAADPDARVITFLGDGGVGFYFMEFDTAVRHNLPIVVVLGNDSAWGIDRQFQLAYYGRSVGTDLRPIRYDRLVAELGGHGEYVQEASELPGAYERALASGKPALINVEIRSVTSPLSEAMIAAKRRAMSGAPHRG